MAKRASLSNLGTKLTRKADAVTAEVPSEVNAPAPAKRGKTQPDGRRGILVRAKPDAWRALKILAVENEVTLQDIMTDAINDMLKKHGKPPLA